MNKEEEDDNNHTLVIVQPSSPQTTVVRKTPVISPSGTLTRTRTKTTTRTRILVSLPGGGGGDNDMEEDWLLSQTLVQAIRLCASLNDYRLILRLMEATLQYCKTRQYNKDMDWPTTTSTTTTIDARRINETESAHTAALSSLLVPSTTVIPQNDTENRKENSYTNSVLRFNNSSNTTTTTTTPLLLATAVEGLGQTSASLAKIRKFWRSTVAQLQPHSITARDVRAMLTVLGKRGRPGAAVQFLESMITMARTMTTTTTTSTTTAESSSLSSSPPPHLVVVDAYCFSLVLNILRDSIDKESHDKELDALTSLDDDNGEYGNGDDEEEYNWISPCWQWNQGRGLMETYLVDDDDCWTSHCWNNFVFSSLLQLNAKAYERFPRQHRGPIMALQVLEVMQEHCPQHRPDVVTCTHVLSCLGQEWQIALQLLHAMQNRHENDDDDKWYPEPNVYSFAAAVACCTRAGEYRVALNLLEQMRTNSSSSSSPHPNHSTPPPNTVVYNTVLQSIKRGGGGHVPINRNYGRPALALDCIVGGGVRRHRRKKIKVTRKQRADAMDRLRTVFELLQFMQDDCSRHGWSTSPDRITYNTVLAVVGNTAGALHSTASVWEELAMKYGNLFAYERTEWTLRERLVHTLLDQMEDSNIERDENTYRQALLSIGSSGILAVVHVVGRMVKDPTVIVTTDLFNMALSVLADLGDVEGIQLLFGRMLKANCRPNSQTTFEFIRAMGMAGKTASLPIFLLALLGNVDAARYLFHVRQLHLDAIDIFPIPQVEHYSEAIASSLVVHDFDSAHRVLVQMQDNHVKESSDRVLEAMGRSYAMLASVGIEAAVTTLSSTMKKSAGGLWHDSLWQKPRVESLQSSSTSTRAAMQTAADTARFHAENANSIVGRIERPSTAILSVTAKSCAATGLYRPAQGLLRRIHRRMLRDVAQHGNQVSEGNKNGICSLHRSLMRSCARQGNVTAALWLTEDIQYFNQQMSCGLLAHNDFESYGTATFPWEGYSDVDEHDDDTPWSATLLNGIPVSRSSVKEQSLGMNVHEWKSLLLAASRSGHWRVCLTTLQFLRPFVEATHPNLADTLGEERFRPYREYRKLSNSLTHAVQCMAVRSQYAWIIRSIDDWIEWSGRRPPSKALTAAFRILCTRGRGEEVHSLLTRCLYPKSSDPKRDGIAYELFIHVSAITALYKAGLYNVADDVFVDAVSTGCLPFNLLKQTYGVERRFTLDLHGMNVAVAHSAVRVALQQEVLSASYATSDVRDNDVVIVTGRGRNSVLKMRPVLRPEVQRMLVEEFYPPLSTTSVQGNLGALRVPASDILEWLIHQRQQKGARMLTVAAVLKSLSSGNFLRAAVTKAVDSQKQQQQPTITQYNLTKEFDEDTESEGS